MHPRVSFIQRHRSATLSHTTVICELPIYCLPYSFLTCFSRFFPDGQVLSLLANEDYQPALVIPILKPSLRMKVRILVTLAECVADRALITGVLHWRLAARRLECRDHQPRREKPTRDARPVCSPFLPRPCPRPATHSLSLPDDAHAPFQATRSME